MDQRVFGAEIRRASGEDGLAVPRHGSYRGLGVGGFHRLHYCDWGQPDNPRVVVCAHGYGRNARDFDGLARDLSTDFRMICPDLAGRGESDWLETRMEQSVPQMLADLNVLVSRIDVCQVDWIGTSLGGLLGIKLAAQPGTPIRRLVVNEVAGFESADLAQHVGGRALDFSLSDGLSDVRCPTLLMPEWDVEVIREFLAAGSGAPAAGLPARQST